MLEAAGLPTVVIATTSFAELAQKAADAAGMGQARICSVPHPIGGVSRAALDDRADGAVDQIVSLFRERGR